MKRFGMVVLVGLLGLVLANGVWAQPGMGPGGGQGRGWGNPYGRMYNPQTVETLSGERGINLWKGRGKGLWGTFYAQDR
jgi:hypothetical protein